MGRWKVTEIYCRVVHCLQTGSHRTCIKCVPTLTFSCLDSDVFLKVSRNNRAIMKSEVRAVDDLPQSMSHKKHFDNEKRKTETFSERRSPLDPGTLHHQQHTSLNITFSCINVILCYDCNGRGSPTAAVPGG